MLSGGAAAAADALTASREFHAFVRGGPLGVNQIWELGFPEGPDSQFLNVCVCAGAR